MQSLACVAGTRKGMGEGKIGLARNARSEGKGKRKRLQRTHCLFRLSRSSANEKSPLVRLLIMRQSLPDTTL